MRVDATRTWASTTRRRICSGRRQVSTESIRCRQIIAEKNPAINAFVCISEPEAHTQADLSRPLSGRPIAIKDNICTKLMNTTCSSAMLKEFRPPYDATVVTLLRDAGAEIIGKTNCDEFGMGSLNLHSIHGAVINPYQPPSNSQSSSERRSAGGSSGGSAAAVAARMCHAALSTDTGGSTRLPASYCGVVGLKPSYGIVSRWGVISFADSLDCVGIMASTISDTRRIFETLAVYDEKDPTAASLKARQTSSQTAQDRLSKVFGEGPSDSPSPLSGLKIGIPQEYFPSELSSHIVRLFRRTIASLKRLGATVVPVSLPSTSYALSAYYVIASAEASSNMARYDGVEFGLHVRPPPGADLTQTSHLYAYSRSAGLGPEVQRRILLGTYALTADAFDNYFLQAQRVRQLVKDDFNHVFGIPNFLELLSDPEADTRHWAGDTGVDVLIHPSAIHTAPTLPSTECDRPGLDAYVQDVLTVPASLAGLPALSVPIPAGALKQEGSRDGETDGWPVGISVVGQWGCDEIVLKVGEIIEQLEVLEANNHGNVKCV